VQPQPRVDEGEGVEQAVAGGHREVLGGEDGVRAREVGGRAADVAGVDADPRAQRAAGRLPQERAGLLAGALEDVARLDGVERARPELPQQHRAAVEGDHQGFGVVALRERGDEGLDAADGDVGAAVATFGDEDLDVGQGRHGVPRRVVRQSSHRRRLMVATRGSRDLRDPPYVL
jgi:hypothetical protein